MHFGGIWAKVPLFMNLLGMGFSCSAVPAFYFLFSKVFEFILHKQDPVKGVVGFFASLTGVVETVNYWKEYSKYAILAGVFLAITIGLFYIYITGDQTNNKDFEFTVCNSSWLIIVFVIVFLGFGKTGFSLILMLFVVWDAIHMICAFYNIVHDFFGVSATCFGKINSFFQLCQGDVSYYVSTNLASKSLGKIFALVYNLSAIADFAYALFIMLNYNMFKMNLHLFWILGMIKTISSVCGSLGFYAMFCSGQNFIWSMVEMVIYNAYIVVQMMLIHFRLAHVILWRPMVVGTPTYLLFLSTAVIFAYNGIKSCVPGAK